jgi:hypothetical protein
MIDHGDSFLINPRQYGVLQRVINGEKNAYNLPISKADLERNKATIDSWTIPPKSKINAPHQLTDREINNALPHDWFHGCVMHDALPPSLPENTAIVINLDDSDGPGTHWVAAGHRNKRKYYFDSFGLPPSERVRKLLTGKAFYSDSQVQQADTITCGYFCIQFLRKPFNDGAYDAVYQFDQKPSDQNEKGAEQVELNE